MDEPRSLRELLECVRARPAMYIGAKSLSVLADFVQGYAVACHIHGVTDELDPDFVRWLATQKRIDPNGISGPMRALVHLTGDDVAAFDRFFSLLDEYEARDRVP